MEDIVVFLDLTVFNSVNFLLWFFSRNLPVTFKEKPQLKIIIFTFLITLLSFWRYLWESDKPINKRRVTWNCVFSPFDIIFWMLNMNIQGEKIKELGQSSSLVLQVLEIYCVSEKYFSTQFLNCTNPPDLNTKQINISQHQPLIHNENITQLKYQVSTNHSYTTRI